MAAAASREVVVKIDNDNDNGCSIENEVAAKSKGKRLTEVAAKVLRRSKDLSDQENCQQPSNLNVENVPVHNSHASPWKFLRSTTRSRLMDPHRPEEASKSSQTEGTFGMDSNHDDDDIEDIPEEFKQMKFSTLPILQWVSLILITAALICSLTFPAIKRQTLWDLPLWKWEILVLALICGRLVSGWGIRIVVIFIEGNFLLRKRVLYFVYGLWRAVQNCLWLGLVLIVWHCIFDNEVEEEIKSRILLYVTKILMCFWVATLIWLLKTLIVKVFASSFHVSTFFERIQEALFNQYVIEALSGRPLFEIHRTREEEITKAEFGDLRAPLLPKSGGVIGSGRLQKNPTVEKSSKILRAMSERQDVEIPIDHLQKLNPKNISAWNMRRMIHIIRHGSLCTLDEQILNSDMEDESLLIRHECQAKEAAKKIFHNVARPGSQFIYLEDVMRFMSKDEALKTMHHFGAATETVGVSKPSFRNWVVDAFRERRALALSLNDTKTAVDDLHNMFNILVATIIVIISLVILGVSITHFLVFLSSQLLLVVFIFGNTCKTTFEAIIFLFVMHPYDVGDACEVDGVQMIVEEMNILTTVFLRLDNQKMIYPNSALATKPIVNYRRSPDMGDTVDFCIHISTPVEKIDVMKDRIKGYIQSRDDHWHPTSSVLVMDVEDMNKLKMSVHATHRMNHQNIGERKARRALLIEEMIKVFRELDIVYRMLPLDVNVQNMPGLISNKLPSNWTTSVS